MSSGPIRVVVVGLGFGDMFLPVYRDHPLVAEVIPFDLDANRVRGACERYGLASGFKSFEEVIASTEVDVVHLATPIDFHVEQALATLYGGKHCGCAVPMGRTLEELRAIVDTERDTGRTFMMMETAVYRAEFFYIAELIRTGAIGRIQFMRAAHTQDLEGWPEYWRGFPPMHYATHAAGPLLGLAKTRATSVTCLGSGSVRPDLEGRYGNPYPAESALFRLEGTAAIAEITRSLFEVAIPYAESFSLYGDRASFEWSQEYGKDPFLYTLEPLTSGTRGRVVSRERISVPTYSELLPEEIRKVNASYDKAGTLTQFEVPRSVLGLVHELVSSVVEGRTPFPCATIAAQWTAAGICAHESAMREGEPVTVPSFISDATA